MRKREIFIISIEYHRLAAIELNRKSQMVSEAVEEVLNLVQDATQKFKSMMSTDSEDIAQGKVKKRNISGHQNLFFSFGHVN